MFLAEAALGKQYELCKETHEAHSLRKVGHCSMLPLSP